MWIHVACPARYSRLRTALVATTLLDLPLVWLFPESPPRFAQSGIVDYVCCSRNAWNVPREGATRL